MNLKQIAPGEIEKRSFEIIEEEVGRELDPVLKPIIKRVIHTTADFSYADTLFFSENAVEKGLQALREGVSIITDTNMGRAGINKKKLEKYGGKVHCFIATDHQGCREHGQSGRHAGGFYFCHRQCAYCPDTAL